MPTFDTYRRMDAMLAAKGIALSPPWWLATIARIYDHATAKTTIARVGRGGAKSTHAVKLAVHETLFGDWKVGRGERHFFAFVSERMDEARQRLHLIECYLDALGVAHERIGDAIHLKAMPLGFRVFSCSIGAVSGFRCIGYCADELAKWSNDGVDPAPEVLASLDAMTITHPAARAFLCSSPMSSLDSHFRAFEKGDNEHQVTATATSWQANPDGITEEACREKSKGDARIFQREYCAIPSAASSAAFDTQAIERAFRPRPPSYEKGDRILVLDPSSGRKDAWTWAVVGWNFDERDRYERDNEGRILFWQSGAPRVNPNWTPAGRPFVSFDLVDGLEGRFWGQIDGDEIVSKLARLARANQVRSVHADQREALMLEAAFNREGLRYYVHDWTNSSKPRAVEHVRRWLAQSVIALPQHEKLKRELAMFEERFTPGGAITFAARGANHDDYVALLVTAALADLAGCLSSSPNTIPPARGIGRRSLGMM